MGIEKHAGTPDDDRVVVRTGQGYRTNVAVGKHRLVADEPVSVGGTDEGPNPYDYLTAGLGACISITLRMYANRKKWPVDEIVVRLFHDKIHAKDCDECETRVGYVDQIDVEVGLIGDLDDVQRQRMMEIADKCPVHRTLHSEVLVKTRPMEAD